MKLQELRTMGKELGVDSPTTYPKRELVLKIMEKNGIVVDQNDLPAPPKRRGGRPRKIRPGEELPVPDIVEPERDTPGRVPMHCIPPIMSASLAVIFSISRFFPRVET